MSTQTFFELEIVTDLDSGLGQSCQYSGNCSNESALRGGMHFRLRHLNTGRLVVMQEMVQIENTILTVGLSEHIGIDIAVNKSGNGSKCIITCTDMVYQNDLETNSIFRLISTGVAAETGIKANTSV